MTRARARSSAATILIAAACVLLFWLVVLPARARETPPASTLTAWDLRSYFLPKFVFGTEELLAGRLPVWNRFEFAGIPFLATAQPAALYPPKIAAFALLSPPAALHVFLVVHHLLAAIGMLVLLRGLGLAPLAALSGALYAALAAPLVLSVYHPSRFASLAWVPWLFAAVEAVGRSGSALAVAALGGVVAAQLFAGYPEITLDCLALVLVHAAARHLAGSWRAPWWRTLPRLGVGIVLGLLLAGPQVFPLAALTLGAERAILAEAAIHLFTRPSMALGLAALAVLSFPTLAGLALGAIGRREALAPLADLACCVVLILVAWPWLRVLPGFAMVRHPLVWSWLGPFFVAWLVALGVDRVAERRDAPSRTADALVALFGAVLVALGLGVLVLGIGGLSPVGASWTRYRDVGVGVGAAGPAAALLGLAGGALLLLHAARGAPAVILAAAVALLGASQLAAFPFGSPLPPLTGGGDAFTSSTLLGRAIGPEDGRVLSIPDVSAGQQLAHRIENVLGAEYSILPPRFGRLLDRLGVNLILGRLDWDLVAGAPGLLDALDVGWVVGPRRLAERFAEHGLEPTGNGAAHLALYRNADPGARAWVVHAASRLASPDAVIDRLLAPDFDPRREVLVEEETARTYPAATTRAPSAALVRREGPAYVEVTTSPEAPGILVLAESCFPGWTASVDGAPARILCANLVTRGVEVDAGLHVVRFTYRAPGLAAGFCALLFGLALAAGLVLARHRLHHW
jgi:hypothetical protein